MFSVTAYSCHADWLDSNSTTRYLIASPLSRKSGGARRYCFVMYNSPDTGQSALVQVTTVTESCHRHVLPGATGQYWAFNMTQHGQYLYRYTLINYHIIHCQVYVFTYKIQTLRRSVHVIHVNYFTCWESYTVEQSLKHTVT